MGPPVDPFVGFFVFFFVVGCSVGLRVGGWSEVFAEGLTVGGSEAVTVTLKNYHGCRVTRLVLI